MKDHNLEEKAVQHLAVIRTSLETISSEFAKFRTSQWLIVLFTAITATATATATLATAIAMYLH